MKKKIYTICLLVITIYLAGCTTVGPYVTDVGFNDEGNLVLTKSTISLVPGLYQELHSGDPITVIIKAPDK